MENHPYLKSRRILQLTQEYGRKNFTTTWTQKKTSKSVITTTTNIKLQYDHWNPSRIKNEPSNRKFEITDIYVLFHWTTTLN